MTTTAGTVPARSAAAPSRRSWRPRLRPSRRALGWTGGALAVIAAAVLFILLTRMRPSYDAFGWLVWGQQILHGHLNTDGAPSWKPLTFLFTLPYALAGRQAQMWLWMVTATASGFSAAVFAGRIAFWLSGTARRGRWAGIAGGVIAGAAVLGMDGFSHVVLIANSDPMIIALCLAALDAHLCRRPRLAFVLLVLASLGRPEAWALTGPYGLWLGWRRGTRTRVAVLLAFLLIPLGWFLAPALTSHSWLGAAKFDLNLATGIHGNKILGVLGRLRGIVSVPMQLAVACSLVAAAVQRDRRALGVAGVAAVWVVVEIAFAYHGFSAVARYLLEPAAVLLALTGGWIGRLLALRPRRGPVLRLATAAPVLALVVALVPTARTRAETLHGQIDDAHHAQLELSRLERIVHRVGGPRRIRACGQPTTLLGYQSELAWVVGLNVGDVGFRPGRAIGRGKQIVLLKPHDAGWQMRTYNLPAQDVDACRGLRTDSEFGGA